RQDLQRQAASMLRPPEHLEIREQEADRRAPHLDRRRHVRAGRRLHHAGAVRLTHGSHPPPYGRAIAHEDRPPLRSASLTTSPPIGGGEEAPDARLGTFPLPYKCGGEVASEAGWSGGYSAISNCPVLFEKGWNAS